MSNPKYIATQDPTDVITGIFTGPTGQLWELEVFKSRIVYKPVARGALLDMAKLAEELNSAHEVEADVKQNEGPEEPGIEYETVSAKSELIVGEPTETEFQWKLRQVRILIAQSEEGKLNLVSCIKAIRELVGENE